MATPRASKMFCFTKFLSSTEIEHFSKLESCFWFKLTFSLSSRDPLPCGLSHETFTIVFKRETDLRQISSDLPPWAIFETSCGFITIERRLVTHPGCCCAYRSKKPNYENESSKTYLVKECNCRLNLFVVIAA